MAHTGQHENECTARGEAPAGAAAATQQHGQLMNSLLSTRVHLINSRKDPEIRMIEYPEQFHFVWWWRPPASNGCLLCGRCG